MPEPTRVNSIPDTIGPSARNPDDSLSGEVHSSTCTRYELGREIARGGMGEVFVARDTLLGRTVAVKVLLDRFTGNAELADRFLEEARVTGQLQHPGIPPVHDLGTLPDGRPFFAMKLIKGLTLAELFKERPAATHDLPRFVQIFEQIGQAVGFAHGRGVVHRDLKPANVMVGRFGEVQVMDWGLAKVLADGPVAVQRETPDALVASVIDTGRTAETDTQAGSVIGTPSYMPPEQARGELDRIGPASDVFSLGGVLCEILTGKPPYTGPRAVVRAQSELGLVDDALARLAACGADPELVSLCHRCLAKDPADRPANAGVVAGLVADYRAGVEERLRSAERARAGAEARAAEEGNTRREAEARAAEQRKRQRVQLALAGVVLILFGVSAVGAWLLDRQAGERQRLEAERETAELRRRVEDEERGRAEHDRSMRNAAAVRALLDRCETALRADDAAGAAAALVEADRRQVEGGVGDLKLRFDQCRQDLDVLRELDRIDELRWAVTDGHFAGVRKAVAAWPSAFAPYGIDRTKKTDVTEAARKVNESLIRERLLAALDDWHAAAPANNLALVLGTVDPNHFHDSVRVAVLNGDNASLVTLVARPEALTQPPRFVVVLGNLDGIPPERGKQILLAAFQHRPGSLPVLMALGDLYPINQRAGSTERIAWYRAALAIRPDSISAWNNLGIALQDADDAAQAIVCYQRVIRLDPKFDFGHNNLGTALLELNDLPGAAAALTEAIRLNPQNAKAHRNLGRVLELQGNRSGAIRKYRESIAIDRTQSWSHGCLGDALMEEKDFAAAEKCYREAARLQPDVAVFQLNVGYSLFRQGDADAAMPYYRAAARLDPDYAMAHNNIGYVLYVNKDLDGAIAEYGTALRLDPKLALAYDNLGDALRAKGDRIGAVAAYREAVRLEPKNASYRNDLGIGLEKLGKTEAAAAAYREASRLEPTDSVYHRNLGYVLLELKNPDGAVTAFREAVRLDPRNVLNQVSLGKGLVAFGDLDGAITVYREVVRLAPDDSLYKDLLADVLEQKAERDAASRPVAPPPREVKR